MKPDFRHFALATLTAVLMSAGCATRPSPTVTVAMMEGRVQIDYSSLTPDEAQAARGRISEQLGEGAGTLDVARGGDAFVVTLVPDARIDMYPLAASVGPDIWFIHGPTLLPGCLGDGPIEGRTAAGAALTVECRPNGYAVLQPVMPPSPGLHVMGPEGSALVAIMRTSAGAIQARFEGLMGPSSYDDAPIGVTVTAHAPSGLVAHVDPNGTILFEVRPGFEPLINPDVARTQVRPLLRHEMFHRWNMAHAISDGTASGWFYEGAAEYAAGRLSLETGDFSEAEYNWLVGAALTRCMTALGQGGLSTAERNRTTDYDCGLAAGWALDLDLRTNGSNFFAFWRELLVGARQRNGQYGDRDWRALVAARGWSTPTLDRLLSGGTHEGLAAAFTLAGADVAYQPAPADYRKALLEPVLAVNCSSRSYGFFDEPNRALLDDDTICEGLPKGAAIVSAAGHALFPDPAEAFAAAGAQCRSGTISLGLASEQTVNLRCETLGLPSASFRVAAVGVPVDRAE